MVCCDPHKVFGVVSDAEGDVFLELTCFFYDPVHVGNSRIPVPTLDSWARESWSWEKQQHILDIESERARTHRDPCPGPAGFHRLAAL